MMRKLITNRISNFLYGRNSSAPNDFHRWYYHSGAWERTTWMGVVAKKSPMDMWLYQEILVSLKPSLFIELGTACGGSALFFATVLRQIGKPFRLLTVDIDPQRIKAQVLLDPDIETLAASSTEDRVATRIKTLCSEFPGPIFAILDSDHSKEHVLAEMEMLRPLLQRGDYLVVEDSNINGHPVNPGWGLGPFEAIDEYFQFFPDDYKHDLERERKFGFTFAPNGFLVRR